jgi:hypothetical protein
MRALRKITQNSKDPQPEEEQPVKGLFKRSIALMGLGGIFIAGSSIITQVFPTNISFQQKKSSPRRASRL